MKANGKQFGLVRLLNFIISRLFGFRFLCGVILFGK